MTHPRMSRWCLTFMWNNCVVAQMEWSQNVWMGELQKWLVLIECGSGIFGSCEVERQTLLIASGMSLSSWEVHQRVGHCICFCGRRGISFVYTAGNGGMLVSKIIEQNTSGGTTVLGASRECASRFSRWLIETLTRQLVAVRYLLRSVKRARVLKTCDFLEGCLLRLNLRQRRDWWLLTAKHAGGATLDIVPQKVRVWSFRLRKWPAAKRVSVGGGRRELCRVWL